MNNPLINAKNSIFEFVGLIKTMPDKIESNSYRLSETKNIIDSMVELGVKNPDMKSALSEEMTDWNNNGEELTKLILNYKSARNIVEKYPQITEYLDAGNLGLSMDVVNLPIIFMLTTMAGSVISTSRTLFEKITTQNMIIKRLKALNDDINTGKISGEQITLEISEIKKKVSSTLWLDTKLVISVSLSMISGYWFFWKTKTGKDIKKDVLKYFRG